MEIASIQKTTLIDFPGKIASVIFTPGCNFRCGYCHNPELVTDFRRQDWITETAVLDFLRLRVGQLEGLVITGGEPSLQSDLLDFLVKVKSLGYQIKLDTNGSFPEVLRKVLASHLVDFVSLDIKAPWKDYFEIVQVPLQVSLIKQSLQLLSDFKIPYECRTTVVREILTRDKLRQIARQIPSQAPLILQKFRPEKTLDRSWRNFSTYTKEEFEEIRQELSQWVKIVEIR